MRLKNKVKKPSTAILAVVIVLVVASIVVYCALFVNDRTTVTDKSSQNTATSTETTDSLDNSNKSNGQPSVHESEKDIQSSYEGQGSTESSSLSGVINYKAVVDKTLVIRATINQLIDSGTCNLTLTSTNEKVYSATADVIENPSSSSCQGFDIPVSSLDTGKWNIEIKIKSGDQELTLAGDIDI